MFKDTGPLGFRIQISEHGFLWQQEMLCVYLYLPCACMLCLHGCWRPIVLPFGFGRNLRRWDSTLGSKAQAKGKFPFLGAPLHLLFSVLLHTLETCINIQSSLKGQNTGCSSSSRSPHGCAFSALKSLPVGRESPLLCPGFSPCLWMRWTPTVVVWLVGLLMKIP